jgi:hypothetical protein
MALGVEKGIQVEVVNKNGVFEVGNTGIGVENIYIGYFDILSFKKSHPGCGEFWTFHFGPDMDEGKSYKLDKGTSNEMVKMAQRAGMFCAGMTTLLDRIEKGGVGGISVKASDVLAGETNPRMAKFLKNRFGLETMEIWGDLDGEEKVKIFMIVKDLLSNKEARDRMRKLGEYFLKRYNGDPHDGQVQELFPWGKNNGEENSYDYGVGY